MNKLNTLLAVALAVILTGCGLIDHRQEYSGPEPSEEQIKLLIANGLKDPDSMKQYRLVYIGQNLYGLRGWVACVELNAKNSYGAYVGMQRYHYIVSPTSAHRAGGC